MSVAKWVGNGVVAATLIGILAHGAWSADNNFKASGQNKGCDSIITDSGQRACRDVQGEKNKQCNTATDCDPRQQERSISDYSDAVTRFKDGKYAKSDEETFKRSIRDMKDKLDAKKQAGVDGQKVANACIAARDNVQKWFEKTAIPLTESTRDSALSERKVLLENLEAAKKKKADAKDRLDKNRADTQAERDLNDASDAIRKAEDALAAFNNKYGEDVKYWADRLISHYNDEKTNHDTPSKQAESRLENCKRVEGLSYPSLPF